MSDISLLEKIKDYNQPHCYQYQRRIDTLEEDKKNLGWDDEFIKNIDLNEFSFEYVDSKEDKKNVPILLRDMNGWVLLVHTLHIGLQPHTGEF